MVRSLSSSHGAGGADPAIEHHHRNVRGGAARAAVFGISDGLQTNVALILGMAGAHAAPGLVRLAGVAGLIGGSFSMAAGEYVSMRAQTELLQRELAVERTEISRRPEKEQRELYSLYRSRGVDPTTANAMASHVMSDPQLALETHAREELGIDPQSLGSPAAAAVASFFSFGVGAVMPLLPWLRGGGQSAVLASVVVAALVAIAVGAGLSRFTGRSWFFSALRQVAIAGVAAAVTFGVGRLVGAGTT